MASIIELESALWTNQVSRPRRLILAPSDPMIQELLLASRAVLVYQNPEVCVLESTSPSLTKELEGGDARWTRVFEEYYLTSTDKDKARGVLVGAFFDWLVDRYGDEIEVSRNVKCYEALYEIAIRLRGQAGANVVLDVGCGPGTILRSQVARTARSLVGFDISAAAVEKASSEGMEVIQRQQFFSGPARFDVALSAYTMHYACDLTDTLAGVQRSLKVGGVWVLNFHKNIGLEAFLERLGSTGLELTTHLLSTVYGSVLAVTKRE